MTMTMTPTTQEPREPPTYSPSAAVPPYSVAPRPSERTLVATARARRRAPTGVLVRSNSLISVALRGQEEDAQMPSYGRHSVICGDIGLSCTNGVQSVYIRVRHLPPLTSLATARHASLNTF